jgi:hypothetical protein
LRKVILVSDEERRRPNALIVEASIFVFACSAKIMFLPRSHIILCYVDGVSVLSVLSS